MTWFRRWFSKGHATRPPIVVHEACGGAIRAFEAPVGPGWTYQEDHRAGDGFQARVLRYKLAEDPAPVTLMAKIYTLDTAPDPVTDGGWRDALGALFAGMDEVVVQGAHQLTMTSMLSAWEVVARGASADGWPLELRERRSVHGREVFILSAVGPRDAMASRQAVVEAWFAHTAFLTAEA